MDQLDPQLRDNPPQSHDVESQQRHSHTNPGGSLPHRSAKDGAVANSAAEEHDVHAAFLPSLQFTSGSDLSGIATYEAQHPAGGPLRTGNTDSNVHAYDHWPTDTQNIQDSGLMQSANQFAHGEAANQFSHDPAANQYVQAGHMQEQKSAQAHHHRQIHATPYDRPTPGASYGTYDGSKPKRKRASPQQLTLLNNIFEMTYFPSSDLRLAIGKELDMVPRSVQIWFQNRRSLWRSKAQQILNENKARKEQLMFTGLSETDADAKIKADRAEVAARQIADQRANDAVEYAINGSNGSLAYALHGANAASDPSSIIDDGSVTRDDEAGAWSVLHAFHQARTGGLVQQGQQHTYMHQQEQHSNMDPQLQQNGTALDHGVRA